MDKKTQDMYEDIQKALATPKDLKTMSLEDQASTLTLHFIGYIAKPIMNQETYLKCLIAFNANRGKVETEIEAVMKVLEKEATNGTP